MASARWNGPAASSPTPKRRGGIARRRKRSVGLRLLPALEATGGTGEGERRRAAVPAEPSSVCEKAPSLGEAAPVDASPDAPLPRRVGPPVVPAPVAEEGFVLPKVGVASCVAGRDWACACTPGKATAAVRIRLRSPVLCHPAVGPARIPDDCLSAALASNVSRDKTTARGVSRTSLHASRTGAMDAAAKDRPRGSPTSKTHGPYIGTAPRRPQRGKRTGLALS